jgi:uncharacterized protein involved in cysteine biosynthesis
MTDKQPKPGARPQHFLGGFLAYWRALVMLAGRPRLWPWVAIPVALTLLIMGLAVYLMTVWTLGWVEGWLGTGGGWWRETVYWTVLVAVALALLFLAYLLFATVRIVIAAPFNDQLALRAEKAYREKLALEGEPTRGEAYGRGVARETAVALLSATRLALAELFAYLIALPFMILPPVGAAVFWLVRGYFAGANALDVILACHGFTHKQKKAIFKRNRLRLFGLGAGVCLSDLTVVLAPVALQVAAMGGAMAYVDLEREGRLSPTP